ncbi:MAG: BamA/TamA family outer membrane protein [Candidatus Atribacteria bacterium]|nr:BamA/TamA family outer membrane protein [Candidatus Atribacteria bacterium]
MKAIKIKRNFFIFFTLLFSLFFLFSSFCLAQNNGKITAIVVRGNEFVDTKLIVSQITSNIGDLFSKEKVQADMQAIFDLGYFQDIQIKLEPFRDGYKVIFAVKENAFLKEIIVEGSTILSEQEIKDIMVLKPGQILSQEILKNDLDRISQLYKDKGLILAQMEQIDFNQNTGVLSIKLAEGKIEEIKITGNEKTVERVIRREIEIETGQIFDFNIVKEALQDIYNLGFFEDVTMKLEPGSEGDLIVLVIDVVEKSTGLFGGGGGYTSGEGLFAYVSIEEANLFGRGQSIKAELEIGTRTTYSLSFYEPWLGNTPTFLGLSVYDMVYGKEEKVNNIDSEYEISSTGGVLRFGREFKNQIQVGLELKSENTSYNLISGELPGDTQEGWTNSVKPILVYDTRDDKFDPTEGWYHTISIESAGGILKGDYDYRKYDVDLRAYLSTDIFDEEDLKTQDSKLVNTINEGVIALRAIGGFGNKDLPSFAKYEIGGLGTVRGYDYEEFVGDTSLVFNIEYRFPLSDNLQGVVFADWGNAWDFGESISISDLKFGKGVGIRFDTPIGPIRIDYGFGEDIEGQAYFSIGHAF